MSIQLWDGNVNDFYNTNLNNYQFINNFIQRLNNSGNDLIEPIQWKLDTTQYDMVNRNAYNQFIQNATILQNNLGKLVENVRMTDYDYQIPVINVPKDTNFSEQDINEFWNTINNIMNWITGQLKFA